MVNKADHQSQLDLAMFSKRKKEIINIVKKEHTIDLATLAGQLEITKMATLKHIEGLESGGMIERVSKKEGVGRPKLYLKLGSSAKQVFPRSYSKLSCSLLHYLEEKYGIDAVREALFCKEDDAFAAYRNQLDTFEEFEEKIRLFTKIRDDQGYMVELNILDEGYAEFIENNCPVQSVAEEFSQICEVEKTMIENILDIDVELMSTIFEGKKVCRFLLREKNQQSK